MKKEKLSQIVDGVYKATISGSLKWSLSNSCFNSDTRHKHESDSSDGVTKFVCEVSLSDDMKLEANNSLYVSNPNMIDGGIYLSTREYQVVALIQTWLYTNLVLPQINISNQDVVMDDILKGIDVSEYRDRKLNEILSDKVKEDEKKSLIKRLFNR